jgi:glycosyltransferase involved in cell wall biosynthesis
MRALFVSENIGGHRTLHRHLEVALLQHPDIDARFVHLPRPKLARRIIGARWPILGRYDLDFQPARAELAAAAVARRLVRPLIDDADVVHWYTANSALLCLDFVRRTPSVTSLDMTNAQNSKRLPYRYPTRFTPMVTRPVASRERHVYERSHAVIAKSEWAAESVLVDYGIEPAKVRVIPFGILPGPAPSPRPPPRPRLVFVGTTLERKGGCDLLDIWRRDLRDHADLVLITKDRVAPEPGLEVIGDIDHGDGRLADILQTSTVFAFPSTMDASPHVVFEAMAYGLPVVVRRSGGMPEQVDDGATGLVIEPDDDDALSAALRKLIDDPALARHMGEAGRRAVEQRFDMSKQLGPIIEVLRATAAGR